jgi:hypothetical protein
VPTILYESIEKPFRDALHDDELLAIADRFLMFIVDAVDPDRPRLIGVFDDESERDAMETGMDEIFDRVTFVGLSEDDCDALPVGQTSVALFLGAMSYVLDLEGFSGEDSALPPALS